MIQNPQFLFFITLPLIFMFSSCSKEDKPTPELGKWILKEQLIQDSGGVFVWTSVDADLQQIEFLEDGAFKGSLCFSFCMQREKSTYNSKDQLIEIILEGGCGTCTFSYKIEEEILFLKEDDNENFTEKYHKI